MDEALARVQMQLEQFAAWQSKLNPTLTQEEFQAILAAYEKLYREISVLYGFAALRFSANTQDQAAQNYMARMGQLAAETQNRQLFFELWWKNLDEETAQGFLDAAAEYHYWLDTLRRQKPYTLTEPEERIINLKNVNGRSVLTQLYSSITNRYTFNLTVNGEAKTITRGELTTYYASSDPELRAAAYQELYRVYAHDAPILGQIYQAIIRDWRSENVDLRHFSTPMSVRNLVNDIPDEVVDTLLNVIQANAPLFHRYFRLKANLLGLDKLHRYDLYAPTGKTEQTYPFAEAASLVLTSFNTFHPRLAELARRVFDDEHLDSEVRPGKSGGAFCAPITPDLTPWVLQSYHGQPNDVATLAHELGHAIHFMLAEHHNALTWLSSLPLMETSSTFGEMLVIDHLLTQDPDPEVHRVLLFKQMDDAYATIMRQGYFALFEKAAHEAVQSGATVDVLSDLYLANLREQFGDAVEVSDDFRHEWVAIPHFYNTPFYVYAYAFGQLLVLSLYEQYKQEGESFKAGYLELLAAGGSASPVEILQKAGIDMHAAAFWQGGFDVLARLLEKLERLANTG
ncbi:MAG: M3 family oligoendopeptidase [Anaerolineae bacterium]|nr:M3 family oligoendopeptidase [Anaerolineae bacterium]